MELTHSEITATMIEKGLWGEADVKEWNNSHDTREGTGWKKRLYHRKRAEHLQEYGSQVHRPAGTLSPKNDRFSKLDSYKPMLYDLMNQGIFNGVVLLERLMDAGYDGGSRLSKNTSIPFEISLASDRL